MNKLRVGVIGGGTVARVGHIPCLIDNNKTELVAVAEPNKELAKKVIEDFNVKKVYTGMDRPDLEMLENEELDAVSICTPPGLHCENTVVAAEMGIHVLCEKPMALTIEECDRMVSSCKKNNVKLQAGFMKRFNIGLKKIKDIISNGELGTVAYVHVHWTMPSAMPRPPMPKGVKRVPQQWVGGGFMADGPHYIDQFRWWIGDIKSVCGEYRPMEKGPFGVFRDVAVAAFSFENNAVGIFHCGGGYCDPRTGSLYEHGEIDGINSSIRWVVPAFSSYELPEIHMMTGVSDSLVPIHPPVSTNPREYFQFYRQMDAFIDCINNDTQPLVTGEDGRAATEVVLAYYQSVDERKTVKLPLKRSPDLPQIMENLASRGNN